MTDTFLWPRGLKRARSQDQYRIISHFTSHVKDFPQQLGSRYLHNYPPPTARSETQARAIRVSLDRSRKRGATHSYFFVLRLLFSFFFLLLRYHTTKIASDLVPPAYCLPSFSILNAVLEVFYSHSKWRLAGVASLVSPTLWNGRRCWLTVLCLSFLVSCFFCDKAVRMRIYRGGNVYELEMGRWRAVK
jgi:hypothetical protein